MTSNGANKIAAADRYRTLATQAFDRGARAALLRTASELAGEARKAEGLGYLDRRYDEEMRAAAASASRGARIAHLEMALRYAVRAREMRQSQPLIRLAGEERVQCPAI